MPDHHPHADLCRCAVPASGRSLFRLALVYAVLMAYGSFVPFHFQPVSYDAFERQLGQMQDLWVIDSRIDFTANVLLGVPLAFLLLGAWSVDRGAVRALAGLLLVLPVCLAWSGLVEVGQIFFPPRTPSLNDIAAQQLGALGGGLLWLMVGQRLCHWYREFRHCRASQGLAGRWLWVYLFILVAVWVMPFDLAVRPQELWEKWKAGGIQLVPRLTLGAEPFARVQSLFGAVAYFVPLGFLWTLARPRRSGALGALAFGLVLAFCLEGAQLFVASRTSSTLDALLGGLGTLLGYIAALAFQRHTCDAAACWRRPEEELRGVGVIATFVWLGVLVVDRWYPFQFQGDLMVARERLSQISWIPLADYVAQPWAHALDELVHRIMVFAVLGAVAALAWPETIRGANGLVLMSVFITAVLLEAGRLWLPMRYPGLTNLLLELLGGGLGLWVMRRLVLVRSGADAGPISACRPEHTQG